MATLDLGIPGERAAHDLVRRMGSGRWPTWRILDICREGQALYVAVEWIRCRGCVRHSLAVVPFDERALRWTDVPTAAAARRALEQVPRLQ